MSFIHTNFFRFSFPIILVAVLLLGKANVTLLIQTNPGVASQLPYLLFAIALVLCQGFNQGRMGMIAIAMAIAYYVIQERLQTPLSVGTTKLEFSLLAFVLPVACIIVYAFPEKRIFSITGLIYITLLGFLCGWCIFTVSYYQDTGLQQLWEGWLFSRAGNIPVTLYCYSLQRVYRICNWHCGIKDQPPSRCGSILLPAAIHPHFCFVPAAIYIQCTFLPCWHPFNNWYHYNQS